MDLGIKVRLVRNINGERIQDILRNVTEIHYCHGVRSRFDTLASVAFESDIHCTGLNSLLEHVVEFETLGAETQQAEHF